MSTLPSKAKLAFRNQFRAARAHASADAEGFQEILYTLERLGTALTVKVENLGCYKSSIQTLANSSPLASDIPISYRHCHTPFDILYDLVKDGRNDALHQGAYARHLTTHAIELSLILEDSLSDDGKSVADYMVRGVTYAELWQPISFIRQVMLLNNFSFLPIEKDGWHFISDISIAKALLKGSKTERKKTLALTLETALGESKIELERADTIDSRATLEELLEQLKSSPLALVHFLGQSK